MSDLQTILEDISNIHTKSLVPGISFIIRCQNEADNLKACLLSIVDLADEIIIVDNLSTDNSFQIMSELSEQWSNIKVYQYKVKIPRPNEEHISMVTTNNRNTIATYYNWCLSKATRYTVFKWDADFIAIRKNLIQMIEHYQLKIREDAFAIWFSGKTLFRAEGAISGYYIRNRPDYYDEFRAYSLKNDFKWSDGYKCEYVEPYLKQCKRLFINSDNIANLQSKSFNLYHDVWKKNKHQSKPIFLEQKNMSDFKPGAATIDIRDTEDNNILTSLDQQTIPTFVIRLEDDLELGHQLEPEMVICTVNYEIFGGAERLAYLLGVEQINKGKHVFFWDYENASSMNRNILLNRLKQLKSDITINDFTYLQMPLDKLLPFVQNKGLKFIINNCIFYQWYWAEYLTKHPEFKFTAISHNHRGWVIEYLDKFQDHIDEVWVVNNLTMINLSEKPYSAKCHLLNLYGTLPNIETLLERKNKDQSKPVLAYINRFSIEKGVILVPHILKHLKPIYPDLTLYLVGYGDEFSQLIAQLEKLEVMSMVKIEGYQEITSKYLQQANFLLFPSLCTEGRPFVVIDAQIHGVEIIATDTEPLREIIDSDGLVNIEQYFDLQNNTILSMPDYPPSIYQNVDKLAKLYADRLVANFEKGFDLELIKQRYNQSVSKWGKLKQ